MNTGGSLRVIVLAVALTWAACATVKVPQPVSGSRSDATIQLAYEYRKFWERPQVDWEAANRIATERCEAWGYSGAEAFGGGVSECAAYGQNSCYRFFVTITYQCIGGSFE